MPSPDGPAPTPGATGRLCFIGDSHLATIRHALDAGVPAAAGWDISFYGAAGPGFRALNAAEGRIVPAAGVVSTVEQVTGGGWSVYDPGEFDVSVFYACRLRIQEYFEDTLHRMYTPEDFVTAQLRARVLEHVILSTRFARIAFDFAARGHRVVFAPTPFLTRGIGPDPLERFPAARLATPGDRDALWREIETFFADRGLRFLRQPDETVVDGCLTSTDFAAPGAIENRDPVHKNAAFGTILLGTLFAALGRGA